MLNVVGSLFAQGSTFALNMVVANLLGRVAFGAFTVVQGTLNTVGTLAQFSMGYTVTKYVAELRDRDPRRSAGILRLCGVISTGTAILAASGLLAGAPWIATYALGVPSLTPSLRIAGLAVLFLVMNGYRMGALAGLECFKPIARVGVASGIIYLILGIVGAAVAGVDGALAGVGGAAAAQWVILGRSLRTELERRGMHGAPGEPWRERSIILNFALPASLSGAVTLPALWLAAAFLVQQPRGLDQIALFGAANSFRIIVLFLPNVVTGVGMSLLNNQLGGSLKEYRRLFWWNLCLIASLAAGGAAVVIVLGPWLLRAFGTNFGDGTAVLWVLMLAAVTEAVASWTYQVIQSQGRMWLSMFWVVIPRDGLILLLAYALTPLHGALGLAAAHAVGWLVALVIIVGLTYWLGLTPQTSVEPRAHSSSPLTPPASGQIRKVHT
jgi:O-antigen/teichoic acid export membrane protein